MSSWPGWASRWSRSPAWRTTPTSRAQNCRSHSWTPIDDPDVSGGAPADPSGTAKFAGTNGGSLISRRYWRPGTPRVRAAAASAAQVGQDREHPPVVVVGWLQAKPKKDGRRVLGDGPLADHQPGGNGRVGAALGHQREHLLLARAERGQGAVSAVAVQQPGNHLRVHHGTQGGYPAHRVDELGAVQHAVLEQVPD